MAAIDIAAFNAVMLAHVRDGKRANLKYFDVLIARQNGNLIER